MNQEAASAVVNPFGSQTVAARAAGGLVSVEQQRAVAQVQAAMIVARSMPRDRIAVMDMILQDCTDVSLAEEAEYEFSRGGSKISGPSIRLLETVARRWGNMESGVKELSRANGYSECEAYAWDMETGYRDSKSFQVKHWRDTKQGGYQLKDERDIYELIANSAARRKRACMEAVIPTVVIRAAADQCALTLKTKVDITDETIKGVLAKFADFGVTKEMVEKRIQRHVETLTPGLFIQLRRIYNSLKDGMSTPAEWFDMVPVDEVANKPTTGASALKAAVRNKPAAVDKETGELGEGASMFGGEDQTQGMEKAGDISDIGVTYEALIKKLETSESIDAIDEAASLIGKLPHDRRNTATETYQARRNELLERDSKKKGGK